MICLRCVASDILNVQITLTGILFLYLFFYKKKVIIFILFIYSFYIHSQGCHILCKNKTMIRKINIYILSLLIESICSYMIQNLISFLFLQVSEFASKMGYRKSSQGTSEESFRQQWSCNNPQFSLSGPYEAYDFTREFNLPEATLIIMHSLDHQHCKLKRNSCQLLDSLSKILSTGSLSLFKLKYFASVALQITPYLDSIKIVIPKKAFRLYL